MARYCPHCGEATIKRRIDHHVRDVCPSGHFIQFARTSIGVGAMIVRDDEVLLIERGVPPVGLWTLVSGYVEEGETLDQAIIREAHEEVGIDIVPRGIIFVRNMQERSRNNVYIVFLCDIAADVHLQPDGVETTDAKFFSLQAVQTIAEHNISPYARWFVDQYLTHQLPPLRWHPTGFDEPLTRIFHQGTTL